MDQLLTTLSVLYAWLQANVTGLVGSRLRVWSITFLQEGGGGGGGGGQRDYDRREGEGGGQRDYNRSSKYLASFPVLPTPAFVSTAVRQKLGWEGLGTRLASIKSLTDFQSSVTSSNCSSQGTAIIQSSILIQRCSYFRGVL